MLIYIYKSKAVELLDRLLPPVAEYRTYSLKKSEMNMLIRTGTNFAVLHLVHQLQSS